MCTPRVQKPNLMARVNCAAARVLAPTESLAAVSREPFAKRRNQSAVCYLIIDREGEWTLMGQKIALLSTWINQHVANEQWARVSTTGLWGELRRHKRSCGRVAQGAVADPVGGYESRHDRI